MPQRPGSLAGPEHLDRALQVTTSKGWLALATLMAMIVAVVVWSLVAQVATYIRGDGIFLSRGGAVFDAAAPVGGTLMETPFSLGDRVQAGEIVAEIHDEERVSDTPARWRSARSDSGPCASGRPKSFGKTR